MAKLYFRYGVMSSGKTLDLIKVYYNYNNLGMNTLIIKPFVDTKGDDTVVSRSGANIKVDYLIHDSDNIYKLLENNIKNNNVKCILVDEVQFMKMHHIDELSDIVDYLNIPVICYGVKADMNNQLFEGSKRLFELSDSIEEVKTICECGVKATCILRCVDGKTVFDGEIILIDGTKSNVSYKSVCRRCYKKYKMSAKGNT